MLLLLSGGCAGNADADGAEDSVAFPVATLHRSRVAVHRKFGVVINKSFSDGILLYIWLSILGSLESAELACSSEAFFVCRFGGHSTVTADALDTRLAKED